jgi:hypothetical protein
MKKTVFYKLLAIFIIIGFIGCELDKPNSNFIFNEEAFMSNWKIWNDQNIKNYSFTLIKGNWWSNSREIEMPYILEFEIIVRNGIMESYVLNGVDEPYDNEWLPSPSFSSISDMYEKTYENIKTLKKWYEDNPDNYSLREFIIEYNNELNYITLLVNKYYNNHPDICCPFHSIPYYQVLNFKILDY